MLARLSGVGLGLGLISVTARAFSSRTVYEFAAKDVDGNDVSMSKYKGYALVIVNVASDCSLTDSNYTQLKEILEKYRDSGLRVAAFPCNQFADQVKLSALLYISRIYVF
ncbi:Putative glutathione peroxidase 7, chloroplastic [Toxocara canis]|uniref:Glutathione peroxidase n=1 Tax=Toxocara canis TaxID=6265 RepID=A0A0B2UKC8_TOXCA|nr:Putative glutathione peroxidase 7, chloroplastic [Toxocara canis]